MKLFGISAKTRIAIGLTCVSVSILFGAIFLKLIPDRDSAILDGRRKLCEAVAINSSVLVSRKEKKRHEAILQAVAKRNGDLVSVGIRKADGELVIEIGDHATHWQDVDLDRSIETQLQVPLRIGESKWGTVEMRFLPLHKEGMTGFLQSRSTRLFAFVGSASFIFFLLYLRKMLSNLDPSKAVPKRVRSALDSLAEGLLVTDTKERILLANQAFANWVGESADKLIGRYVSKLPWATNDGQGPEDYPWKRAVDEETQIAGVEMQLIKNGQPRNLMANASPVLGQDGKYRGVIISLDDVTQLEDTKRELHKSKLAADEANRSKSEFLARMSHEIRTPMNAILGFADVLRRGIEGSRQERQDYLNTIHTNGQHLLNLINDILDLSKVESGKLEVESRRCSPYKTVSEVATVLRMRANEKGITLDVKACGDLPETIVSDPVRLRQIVTNLVGNAIKFTEQGGVRVDLRMKPSADQPQLVIDVIDSGIGIKPEALDTVFNPFSQADTSITRQFGGTGLGLSISKRFAEALGGGVSVKSEYGMGSVFSVTISTGSLEGVRLLDPQAIEAEAQKVSQHVATKLELPPCRILVADDGESNRKLINLVLRRAGAEVENAENGQIAVDLASQQAFDVILMDMQMPVMDGYTATRTLREQGMTIPIIALTADAMQGAEERCREAGCSGFMTKPIDMDKVIQELAKLLGGEAAVLVDQPAKLVDATIPQNEASDQSLVSSLPTEDPDFAEIVVEFAVRFGQKLDEMQQARQRRDFEELGRLAHWLKGSGGTAGFSVFTELAKELEAQSRNENIADIDALVEELQDLAARIVVPGTDNDSLERPEPESQGTAQLSETHRTALLGNNDRLVSSLPTDDPEFAEIVVDFANRLGQKLDEMEKACQQHDFEELGKLAHWLKGSGGTAGFGVLTELARELEAQSRDNSTEQIEALLTVLQDLAARIVIPGTDNESVEGQGPKSRQNAHLPQKPPDLLPDNNDRLVSSLPTDDPDFAEIVVEFVGRLEEQLDAMERAYQYSDREELGKLAHWLKGSGGMAGFDVFTALARELETITTDGPMEEIGSAIAQLRELAQRTEVPGGKHAESPASLCSSSSPEASNPQQTAKIAEPAEPLCSTLPTEDPEFRGIVVEFADRLNEKLVAMDQAWRQQDFAELASLAHWLKGSGGTAGFDAFTSPARQLETFAKSGKSEDIASALDKLRRLADRIEITSHEQATP